MADQASRLLQARPTPRCTTDLPASLPAFYAAARSKQGRSRGLGNPTSVAPARAVQTPSGRGPAGTGRSMALPSRSPPTAQVCPWTPSKHGWSMSSEMHRSWHAPRTWRSRLGHRRRAGSPGPMPHRRLALRERRSHCPRRETSLGNHQVPQARPQGEPATTTCHPRSRPLGSRPLRQPHAVRPLRSTSTQQPEARGRNARPPTGERTHAAHIVVCVVSPSAQPPPTLNPPRGDDAKPACANAGRWTQPASRKPRRQ
mmetsp:Transcript_6865/g.25642  ORF Transcript_6865/g.25642 Transcript_6865/m.25642 type:complete len:257 (+) Transcript_6865:924-1694(+)